MFDGASLSRSTPPRQAQRPLAIHVLAYGLTLASILGLVTLTAAIPARAPAHPQPGPNPANAEVSIDLPL